LAHAELRIARDIVCHYDADAWMRLHAVNTFMKVGLFEEAKRELQVITNRFGLKVGVNHIKTFAQRLGLAEIEARAASL
jgi:hypothetical protein